MLKSMTGFGRGEYEDEKFSATIEMKTVNHRYNEVAIRLPRFLNPADYTNDELCTIKVDKALAAAYHNALQEVADAAGLECKMAEQAEVLYLARCPEVINVKEGLFDVETIWPKLEAALQQAIGNLVAMRETEGGNIYGDFIKRADLIEEKLKNTRSV